MARRASPRKRFRRPSFRRASKSAHAKMSGGVASKTRALLMPRRPRRRRGLSARSPSGRRSVEDELEHDLRGRAASRPDGIARMVSVMTLPHSGCLSSMTMPETGSTPPQNDNPVLLKARRPVTCVAWRRRRGRCLLRWRCFACQCFCCHLVRAADVVAFRRSCCWLISGEAATLRCGKSEQSCGESRRVSCHHLWRLLCQALSAAAFVQRG